VQHLSEQLQFDGKQPCCPWLSLLLIGRALSEDASSAVTKAQHRAG
jgi:hypothetical protein